MIKNQPRQKAVVIGAGIGGLSAAIRLATAGLDVTVIEARPGPGGKVRTLPSIAGPVDAGPTVLTLISVFADLFTQAGERLEDFISLVPQPILARHWWQDGSQLDLHANPEASAAAIYAFAGQKAETDFRQFNRKSQALYSAFDGPMIQEAVPNLGKIALNAIKSPRIWKSLMPRSSLSGDLASSFQDIRLRQLFGRYSTYVGGAPDLSPAVLSLIWHAEARGVWVVKGGMYQLAKALADLAIRQSAELRYDTIARKIEHKTGQVTGVMLSDGTVLKSDLVVFNGDPAALLAGLLGNGAQTAVPPTAAHPRSLSAWVWAFAAKPNGKDLLHHNVFFADSPDTEFGPIARGKMPEEATLYVCAQDRQSESPASDTTERFEIIMNAPPKTTIASGELDQCRAKTFQRLAQFGLTFDQAPADSTLTGPAGFAQLFPGSQGSIYGRSPHGLMASFQRPGARTKLTGLYLAGGGAHPGAGVPMAALSGKHAAEAILKDLHLTSPSPQTAMRGGMSMVSRMMGRAPSR